MCPSASPLTASRAYPKIPEISFSGLAYCELKWEQTDAAGSCLRCVNFSLGVIQVVQLITLECRREKKLAESGCWGHRIKRKNQPNPPMASGKIFLVSSYRRSRSPHKMSKSAGKRRNWKKHIMLPLSQEPGINPPSTFKNSTQKTNIIIMQ